MTTGARIARAILYLFIISSGVQVGAAIYEATVITPLWAGAPPESVTHWNSVAEYAINPGHFWRYATLFYTLCGLLMLIGAWALPRAQRKLAVIAGAIALIAFLVTFFYFVPVLMKTIVARGEGLSGEEITQMVHSWVKWTWVRLAGISLAWLAAIRALGVGGRDQ